MTPAATAILIVAAGFLMAAVITIVILAAIALDAQYDRRQK